VKALAWKAQRVNVGAGALSVFCSEGVYAIDSILQEATL